MAELFGPDNLARPLREPAGRALPRVPTAQSSLPPISPSGAQISGSRATRALRLSRRPLDFLFRPRGEFSDFLFFSGVVSKNVRDEKLR